MAVGMFSTPIFCTVFTGRGSTITKDCFFRAPLLSLRVPTSSLAWSIPCSLEHFFRLSTSPVYASRGGRFSLYNDSDAYVLIEPGEDELFVDLEELRLRLKKWLENWPDSSLPTDLARFEDLDEAVTYLIDSACELEITDGSGTVQWFEVRLEQN
ncbi:hypothetical protein KP509_1Z091800 [Ceratopteris richardii]|nr:hypothetical protein KP509_1Z091800 [Ceratopteris richardii]